MEIYVVKNPTCFSRWSVREEYNKIKEKRYNLRQLSRDCDSKSMERKLEEKIRELDKKSNYYLETDKWIVELDEYDYYD